MTPVRSGDSNTPPESSVLFVSQTSTFVFTGKQLARPSFVVFIAKCGGTLEVAETLGPSLVLFSAIIKVPPVHDVDLPVNCLDQLSVKRDCFWDCNLTASHQEFPSPPH